MASNTEGENERIGEGVRQTVYNEVGQSNQSNLINQSFQSEKITSEETKNPTEAVNQASVSGNSPPVFGNAQTPFYGNFYGNPTSQTVYGYPRPANQRRLKKKRKNRAPNTHYPAYTQSYGYPQYGYNQCYPGYTQSYPGYTQSYGYAQSYPASPQLSMYNSQCNTYDEMQSFRKFIKRYQNLRRLSKPIQTRTTLLRCPTKSRRRYPKVCGDRTSNRKYDNKSYKTFAITSHRGMKAISQEEKSIPMLEVIAPYRKCERERYKKNYGDVEENRVSDLSEAGLYAEVADKLLTNKYLEEERKFLEHSRKAYEKPKNKWEQLLKSSKKEEDLLPETIAAVIFSEEKGLSLKTIPEVTYQKLFPEDKFKPVVKIVKAGQDKNAMIPVSLSPADGFLGDEDGAFFETYMKNDFEIPESMPTQVGSRTSEILSGTPNENKDFDIPLEPSAPSRENFVQLRGSVPPKWFPGYVFALPNSSDTIRVDQPYQVFEQGWRAFSPTKSSTPEGIIVVGN